LIFIDTGAFLARYLSHDQYHRQSRDYWDKLRNQKERLFTSNFILDETFTLLGRRAGYSFAVQRAENIYVSKILTILRPDQSDELKAIRFFGKYADQSVSFTDCISFVLMGREKIRRVFTFDHHFEWAGFKIYP